MADTLTWDQLTPEQQSEISQQAGWNGAPPPAPTTAPSFSLDEAVTNFTPEQLADLSISTKGKAFDPVRYALSNPPVANQNEGKLADTYALLRERGFKFSDIDLKEAAKGVWAIFPGLAKWSGRALELGVVNPIGNQLASDMTPQAKAEFEKQRTGKSAELVASTESALFGLGTLARKGLRKAGEKLGVIDKPDEQDPAQRVDEFWTAVGIAKYPQEVAEGRGTITRKVLGGAIDQTKAQVNPQEVEKMAAGDPVSLLALPAAGKAFTAPFRAGLAAARTATAAEQGLAAAERGSVAAQEALTGARAAASAGGSATKIVQAEANATSRVADAAQAVESAREKLDAARQGLQSTFGASTIKRAGELAAPVVEPIKRGAAKAGEAISNAATRATDVALGTTVGAAGTGLRTAGGLGRATSLVLPSFIAPRALRAASGAVRDVGKGLQNVAGDLLEGNRAAYSPRLRLVSDLARTAPDVAAGAAKGFLMMDVPLAAATSETPQETAHMPTFGALFGSVGALPRAAGRVVSGQLIMPRTWEASGTTPLRDYRNFRALDEANRYTVDNAGDPAQTQRLAALREFLKPTGAQMYWVEDPQLFKEALQRYAPGREAAWYDEAANQRAVRVSMTDDAGQRRSVVLVRDLDAAPHDAIHPFQDVLGENAMGKIDDLVYQQYGPQWDNIGNNYAMQFFGPKEFARYAQAGEGWREAIIDLSTGRTDWRGQVTPEQIEGASNRYLAREISAEIGDSVLKNAGPKLVEEDSLPGKIARVLGKTMVGLGLEPFEGQTSEGQNIPLNFETTEAVRRELASGVADVEQASRRPDMSAPVPVEPKAPRGTPPAEPAAPAGTPPAPATPSGPAAEARALLDQVAERPTIRGGRSPREVLNTVADAIESGEGLSVDYHSAPGEPAGAVTSNRGARRDVIEAFRNMPADVRPLFEKMFFPDQAFRVGGGKIQVMGWSPEVFASNAQKWAAAVAKAKAVDVWNTENPRYQINGTTFTPDGWKNIFEDTQNFVKNQKAGATGAGGPLVVPKDVEARGFTAPEQRGDLGAALPQGQADFISALFGIKLPSTPRVGNVFPRNLIGQEVSEATLPGRTSIPVEPRAPFSGEKAAKMGAAGREIKEVNPFRQQWAERGVEPSTIEALQRLNLEYMADASPVPTSIAPEFRGNEFTLQAGFQPRSLEETVKTVREATPEQFKLFIDNQKIGLTKTAYQLGASLTDPAQLAEVKAQEQYHRLKSKTYLRGQMFDKAATEGAKAQFYREAGEYATETGSSASAAAAGEQGAPQLKGAQFQPKTKFAKELEDEGFVFSREGQKGFRQVYVDKDGHRVGSISATQNDFDPGHASLNMAIVGKDFQRQGVGEALYRELFSDLKEDGVDRVSGDIVSQGPAQIREKIAPGKTKFSVSGKTATLDEAIKAVGDETRARNPVTATTRIEKGAEFQPNKGSDEVKGIAATYTKDAGIDYKPTGITRNVNPVLGRRLADFYEEAKSNPDDPVVKASYDALAKETVAQYKAITDAGYTLEPWTGKGEPYKNSAAMVADVHDNKHLYFLPTGEAFEGGTASKNAMLEPSGINDWPVNDVFRAVHDFFGHAKDGYQFGPKGEFNAWASHSEMYSPEAQGALAAETLAQNSFVNFGKHLRTGPEGAIPEKGQPGYVPLTERPFAEQKNLMVPQDLIDEARAQFAPRRKEPPEGQKTRIQGVAPGDWISGWANKEGDVVNSKPGTAGREHHIDLLEGNTYLLDEAGYHGEEEQRVALEKVSMFDKSLAAQMANRGLFPFAIEPWGGVEWYGNEAKVPKEIKAKVDKLAKSFPRVSVDETADFAPRKKEDWKVKPGSGGFTKTWILPNGEPVQLGGQFHNVWLNENAKAVAKRWKMSEKDAKGDEDTSRIAALKAGFVRANLSSNGALTFELRRDDLRKQKNPIYDFVDNNASKIDSIRVTLFNPSGVGVVDSAIEQVFRLPAKERADNIPFVSTDAEPRSAQGRSLESIYGFDPEANFQPKQHRGETEGLPGLEAPREVVSGKEYSSMSQKEKRDHYPEAVVPKDKEEGIPSDILGSPLYKRAGSEGAAVEAFKKRLVDFARENESNPAYQAGLKWYDDFTPQLQKEFGKDAQLMAELLAATSPNTNPEVNFGYAFDALQSFRDGRFTKIVPKFEQGLEKIADGSWEKWYAKELEKGDVKAPPQTPTPAAYLAHWIDTYDLKPKQSNGKLYGMHSTRVLQVLARRWMQDNTGPKTRNFVGNLLGNVDEATIDVWADRTMRWAGYEGAKDRWRILPENGVAVSDPDFAFSQKAFRAAADELGIKPSALQGGLWFAEKQRWADNGWSRLDLGDFRTEMQKVPLLKQGYKQRVKSGQNEAKSGQQLGLDVEPRSK